MLWLKIVLKGKEIQENTLEDRPLRHPAAHIMQTKILNIIEIMIDI